MMAAVQDDTLSNKPTVATALVFTLVFGALGVGAQLGFALPVQEQVVVQPDGNRVVTLENGATVVESSDGSASHGGVPSGAGGKPGKPGEPGAMPSGGIDARKTPINSGGQGGAGEAGSSTQRPSTPPEPPEAKELEVRPDGDGLVRFHFRNQPWPDVLRWLAQISNLSLDWQELPGDYINLATQRPYTIEETTDTINRALLLRGFTILRHDGVMLVAKVDGINPALVPRVEPDTLAGLPANSFVRTSFALNWLIAEEVNQEFSAMLSRNGKLTPLMATNRLEAMDAASNLRDIHNILTFEQSGKAKENLAREFVLKHARASAIKLKLEEFLGVQQQRSANPNRAGRGGDPMQMMQQQMQMQMQQQMQQQMQMQQAQAGAAGAARPQRRSNDLFLIANDRANSLIVHASPDKMAIIEAFVQRVDVPNENAADFQRLNTRMRVFRLASLNPNHLVESLTEMDVLEPGTRLRVDETNNAIIAYASVADQYLIQSVVERLDGSERSFEVIRLRRLEAEAVAGSIKFLMGAEEEDASSNRRNYGYYDYYGYGGRSSTDTTKKDKMRVGANIQDNQLLLWANAIEMDEVRNLLVKLGEVPPEGGRRDTVRIIDASRQPETFEYLQRLKEQWERVSPNPLDLPDPAEFTPRETGAERAEEQTPPAPQRKAAVDDSKTTWLEILSESPQPIAPPQPIAQIDPTVLVSVQHFDGLTSRPMTASGATDAEVPPVSIRVDQGGNLVLQSLDTQALDLLEEYMLANRPPRKPYDIFKVRYARASWVTLNLREYFEKKQEDRRPDFYAFFFDDFRSRNKDESQQLGKKSPLRFIYDNDTNSIVVTGASDSDRQTIKELIELWDVPEPKKGEDKDRYTRLIRIKYSRADAIVNTIKEAYRDLLSATDKSVQNQAGNQEEKRSGEGGGVVQPSGGLSFAFKGKLSLGADTITNSILVSAEGEALMKVIADMIQQLDEAARPEGNVEVYKLSGDVNGKSLERALRAILGTPNAQQQQQQQQQPQQQQQQPAPNGQPNQAPSGNRRATIQTVEGASPSE
jgi:type II secretory pathway component GspD/PulD (secretin)